MSFETKLKTLHKQLKHWESERDKLTDLKQKINEDWALANERVCYFMTEKSKLMQSVLDNLDS